MSFKRLVSDLNRHTMMQKSHSQRRTSKMLLLRRKTAPLNFRKALDKVSTQLNILKKRADSNPRLQRKNQMLNLRQRIEGEHKAGEISGSQADALRNHLDDAAVTQGIKL